MPERLRDMSNQQAFLRFKELLETRQVVHDPALDIRKHVLSLAKERTGFGYVSKNVESLFGANLPNVFESIVPIDRNGIENCDSYFALGTIYQDQEKSHKGAVRLFNTAPLSKEMILFEAGFLATTHSWSHSFREGNRNYACLGYVYDDIAHYFMADYPNRIIRKLNSDDVPSKAEIDRAHGLLQRIVSQRISKYNAQPMKAPAMTEGYDRRVLVCDQAYADASTVYGKVGDAEFERMLLAAISENPDAEILVKTHPDSVWEKDKRSGYYSHLQSTGRVRILRETVNPYALFDLVDTVYVGTSQMGLEALFAGKKVVTFGAPFYAGWGLTDDRQAILHRHRKRSLAEIFHYFYIWYTIYHLPDKKGPAEIEDILSYIETHRPYPLPPNREELDAPPRVSVIIPVHGVEKYVEDCITSIQRQSLREIEIIPVNDNSPDRSQEIIDRLAAADPRIRPIVLSENIGQGFARNRGLEAARGDYIWFIDSDDWLVDPEFLEKTVEAAEQNSADMTRAKKAGEAIFDKDDVLLKVTEDKTESYFSKEVGSTTYQDNTDILHSRHFCLWLYRRNFLREEEISFVTTQWEERAFLLKALLRAEIITLTTNRCFMYRIRLDSTARRQKGILDVERFLQNIEHICSLLKEHGAVDRAGPLRTHLDFQLSQFLHVTFFGFWYDTLIQECDDPSPYFERLATALERVDFWPSDLTNAPTVIKNDLFGGHIYHLITAALRARRFDWIRIATKQTPVAQNVLYDEFFKKPVGRVDKEFQAALNIYARNERVQKSSAQLKTGRRMPRIVIHIGATKTGSTFIQHMLDKNRPALLRNGIWVPEIGLFWQPTRPHKQAGHAHFLAAAVQGDTSIREHILHGLDYMNDRVHTIVLTSEAFFLNKKSHLLADYFSGHPIEMVVYLRRQDEWANSQYCEFVSGGAVGRVDKTIDEWLKQSVTRDRLNYLQMLTAWSKKIGQENVRVRVFDRSQLKSGDIIDDFAQTAALPELLDMPRPQQGEQNDARLSSGHVELLRLYNSRIFNTRDAYFDFIEEVGSAIARWRQAVGLPQQKPWMLTNDQAEAVMLGHAETNAIIARDYLNRHNGLLFSPASEKPNQSPIFFEEISIIDKIYQRHAAQTELLPEPKQIAPVIQDKEVASAPYEPRILNYGLFGWRLWLLTPIFATFYARIVSPERFREFLVEPADYASQHWRGRRPVLSGLLYPQGNPLGPVNIFKIWFPFIRRLINMKERPDMQEAFEREPILFVRRIRNPISRGISRLMFPVGELR